MMQEIEEAVVEAKANTSVPVRTSSIVKKGILSKKSRSKYLSGPWTLRTFILDKDNRLSYYDGKTFKGEVLLAGTIVNHVAHDAADGRTTYPFQISNISSVKRTQGSSLLLAAGSFQEADDWVSCLARSSAGSTSTGAAGYITFEDVTSTGAAPTKVADTRELREKRLRTNSSKDNLLKYSDVVDYSSSDEEDN